MSSVSSLKTRLAVWVSLLVLLGLSTASSYVPLGTGNTLINLAIAIIKVGLIALFFMHLRRSDAAVRLAAGAALLFLFFMAFLTFGDLLTRALRQAPWQSPAESPGGPYGSVRECGECESPKRSGDARQNTALGRNTLRLLCAQQRRSHGQSGSV